MTKVPLPIDDVLPNVRAALTGRGAAVLQAPPGAGKTTRVPLALLGEPWLGDRLIVMLEPRRLAARAAAQRMAATLDEPVGRTVGYRMRMDTRVSRETRIEVVTEGVLTRMLQDDATLDRVGCVIFDEFHERSLPADLGLALVLHTRALVRDDLRVLVMSATLDGAPVAALLADSNGNPAPMITSEGRAFPVEMRRIPQRAEHRLEPAVAAAVQRALRETAGDVLVFLPGAGEIHRVETLLDGATLGARAFVTPLHGSLSQALQDRALAPAPPGQRKIVLATSIAETSLTIDGVHVVVDAGLSRVPRFSPRTGMTRLETVRVSTASADQRTGRAGRTAPGVCYRMWPAEEDAHLLARARPEILEADLAPLVLDLAAAGVHDASALAWLDAPPDAALAQGRDLLVQLDALDARGRLTDHGRAMAELPMHPRLAHMVLRARALGHAGVACVLAAIIEERDMLRGERGPADADIALRLALVRDADRGERAPASVHGAELSRDALRRVLVSARQLARIVGVPLSLDDVDMTGLLLAFAYPDRIAVRREGASQDGGVAARYLLRNGRGASFPFAQPLGREEWIVAAALDGAGSESRILLAAPVTRGEIEAHFASQAVTTRSVEWDAEQRAVVARERTQLGAIVLAERPMRDADPVEISNALIAEIRRVGLAALPWSEGARRLRERLAFVHALDATWPAMDDASLLVVADEWLAPAVEGVRRWDRLTEVDWSAALMRVVGWERRARLDELAPTHIEVPTGSRIAVDYSDPAAPALAVKLQEMFGLSSTPTVGGGRVPLTLHLLSPAQRPVQVTRDLAGFWRGSYHDVRKDLRGRYPKHDWPDDPAHAAPSRGAKRRQ